jgi:proteasome alpha subunit
VEVCVAQVGFTADQDEMYRITYDGSVQDEPGIVVMGGQAEALAGGLRERHRAESSLTEGLHLAVNALASVGGEGGQPRTLAANQLEVAILDRRRRGRTFRRITGAALTALLETPPVETVDLPADQDTVVTTEAAPPAEPADTAPPSDAAESAPDAEPGEPPAPEDQP